MSAPAGSSGPSAATSTPSAAWRWPPTARPCFQPATGRPSAGPHREGTAMNMLKRTEPQMNTDHTDQNRRDFVLPFLSVFSVFICGSTLAAADRPDPAALAAVVDRFVAEKLAAARV